MAQLHEAQKLETLGQLTGGVAHDFNNLLTPITGALDLLQRKYGDSDERSARLLSNALQAADRAKTLLQRLLGFARRQALHTQPVDIGALLSGMRDLIASSVGPTVEVHLRCDPDLPSALVDPNQLELAILNLSVNARDAMPRRWAAHHPRRGESRSGRARTEAEARPVYPPVGDRRRLRNGRRDAGPRGRALLLDQGIRPRHRAWPVDGPRPRRAARRRLRADQRAGRRDARRSLSAGRRRSCASRGKSATPSRCSRIGRRLSVC